LRRFAAVATAGVLARASRNAAISSGCRSSTRRKLLTARLARISPLSYF